MGNSYGSLPEARILWTQESKSIYNDTVPVVSGDGSTVAVYQRHGRKVSVFDGRGQEVCEIPCIQKMVKDNVGAIPSLSHDGSKIVIRDSHSVFCYNRTGTKLWAYTREDKMVRSNMQSWIAQISNDGSVVVVRMFHELIFLSGDNGDVLSVTETKRQYANSIPRISDNGEVVICSDGPHLLGFLRNKLAWNNKSPVPSNGVGGHHWGDPAISGNGKVAAAIGKRTLYIVDAHTGEEIAMVRKECWHRDDEFNNEASFNFEGTAVAVATRHFGIAVFGGDRFSACLLRYNHKGTGHPRAPLLSRDGKTVIAKAYNTLLIWQVTGVSAGQGIQTNPSAVLHVEDTSEIPGGCTVHNQHYHNDRDSHHKRTFTASHDGSLCVAVAKMNALWAFTPSTAMPQGGAIS